MARYNYVIGDVQGCFEALKQLLKTIQFDPDQDFLWFAGDLVARGENSVGALRFVKKMADRGVAATVLGNHDLNLLACARDLKAVKEKDNIQDIIDAVDADELIDWLRRQPLCLMPNPQTIITHAGIPPQWDVVKTQALAQEVQAVLSDDNFEVVDTYLKAMYGTEPALWSDALSGQDRLRAITNALTRMRLCDEKGQLEFSFKDSLDAEMPQGYRPWFEYPSQAAATHQVIFGHWAALQGQRVNDHIQNVDGGCVWGQHLIAYRLEDQQSFAVENPLTADF